MKEWVRGWMEDMWMEIKDEWGEMDWWANVGWVNE